MSPLEPSYKKNIKTIFPLDTESTTCIQLSTNNDSTRLFKVDARSSRLLNKDLDACYIIDTPEGQKIASFPHIVGEKLASLSLSAALKFKDIISSLSILNESTGILHILRGSSGYRVHKVLPELPLIRVRTEYKENGYRSHNDDSKHIVVTYSENIGVAVDTLIIPDTFATGRSIEAALNHVARNGTIPTTIVLYGFIAIPSILRLSALCKSFGTKLTIFSICNITQLASNNYDMTLFGYDEHSYSNTGEKKPLGSIVDAVTLDEMMDIFIPGLDQPGDWSERQKKLYNGYTNEVGDIRGHLTKSITFIESLDKLNKQQGWYTENVKLLTKNELTNLRSLIRKY